MQLHETYGVHASCETLSVRRSTFYHYQRRRPERTMVQMEDDILKPNIQQIFEESKGRLGSKKIRIKLMGLGFTVSVSRVTRLMKEMGLACVSCGNAPKKMHCGSSRYYRNKLGQQFTQIEPNKAWVSDITYLYVNYCMYYLCIIIDLFSRKVVSYALSEEANASLAIETYQSAYNQRRPTELLFHSDQGTQYTAYEFKKLLRQHHVQQSFSNVGYPYDNAVAESFFRTLKAEEISQYNYSTFNDLHNSVKEYIDFFNNERPHQKLNYLTPNQVEDNYFGQKNR